MRKTLPPMRSFWLNLQAIVLFSRNPEPNTHSMRYDCCAPRELGYGDHNLAFKKDIRLNCNAYKFYGVFYALFPTCVFWFLLCVCVCVFGFKPRGQGAVFCERELANKKKICRQKHQSNSTHSVFPCRQSFFLNKRLSTFSLLRKIVPNPSVKKGETNFLIWPINHIFGFWPQTFSLACLDDILARSSRGPSAKGNFHLV